MPFHQLYYHFIWATRNRLPLLTAEVEPVIHGFLWAKAVGLGAHVYALNGTEDHMHLVVAVPPTIALSKFIGQIKGVASTRFNKSGLSEKPFFWQEEYGVLSFDAKRLPNYIAYVNRQKEHHASQTLIAALERSAALEDRAIHEPTVDCEVEPAPEGALGSGTDRSG